ncbi:MAG: M1 family peptidase [Nitrospirae bacterium]|nr:M1 family peptidase [Nitrospirota bacterium]
MIPVRSILFNYILPAYMLIALSSVMIFDADISHADGIGRASAIHHDLKVALSPDTHSLTAEDTITLPDNQSNREIRFALHQGLSPSVLTPDVHLSELSSEPARPGLPTIDIYRVTLPAATRSFTLKYSGVIYHPIDTEVPGRESPPVRSDTSGLISEEGAYLSASSFWHPYFDEEMVTFTLTVTLPPGWDAVSQGFRAAHARNKGETIVQWASPETQEGIWLIAARFSEYERSSGGLMYMVFLRSPDNALAEKYLEATARYIPMYEKLIGPYPYRKFALVENFWETGFGMPSFTLLGSKIIRFPFIITSSYPHEILHNWWGNGVFPDIARGNWSEGLTAYLADHMLKEQQGSGADYRQESLQKYTDYVLGNRDFPIAEFRVKHSPSSEAIGYGKSLMFFHMLRLELGDNIFTAGLRDFYRDYKFRLASFDDLRKTFEKASGRDLREIFDEWLLRTGAPKLKLRDVAVAAEKDGYLLTGLIEQVQPGKTYRLLIPLAVTMDGKKEAYQTSVVMDKRILEFSLRVPAQPLRLDVDPAFDLFRRLDRDEIPPALSQALGAKKILLILPSAANSALLRAYRNFADTFIGAGPDSVEIRLDTQVAKLPSDRAVMILGWQNLFVKEAMTSLSDYGVAQLKESLRIGKDIIPHENYSVVLTSRHPGNREMALTLIATTVPAALPGLAVKIPHYNKYSYIVFEGNGPTNTLKGRWRALHSPMTSFMKETDVAAKVEMAELLPRPPLAALPAETSIDKELLK